MKRYYGAYVRKLDFVLTLLTMYISHYMTFSFIVQNFKAK